MIAIFKENEFAVNQILKTKKIKDIQYYFDLSCDRKSLPIVKMLYKYGAKIDHENGYFSNLMSACSRGSYEVVEFLLKKGAPVNNWRSVDGITALMLAAFNGEEDKVRLLIKHGANKWQLDSNGKTALDYVDRIYPRLKISEQTKENLRRILK